MTCAHCAQSVRHALTAVEGVESALVNVPVSEAEVQGTAEARVLVEAVEKAVYGAAVQEQDDA